MCSFDIHFFYFTQAPAFWLSYICSLLVKQIISIQKGGKKSQCNISMAFGIKMKIHISTKKIESRQGLQTSPTWGWGVVVTQGLAPLTPPPTRDPK